MLYEWEESGRVIGRQRCVSFVSALARFRVPMEGAEKNGRGESTKDEDWDLFRCDGRRI